MFKSYSEAEGGNSSRLDSRRATDFEGVIEDIYKTKVSMGKQPHEMEDMDKDALIRKLT